MHRHDHEMLARHMRQHVAHELQLPLADQAGIGAAARSTGVVAEVVHVIEHDERGARMLEGVVARPEHPLPGLARAPVVAGLRVDVVVARAVVPGDAGRTQDLQVARVEREVVEHDVAVVDAEGGLAAERAGDDVVAQVAELGAVRGLRVGEQQGLEARRSPPAASAESR